MSGAPGANRRMAFVLLGGCALAALLLASVVWRLGCVSVGPDPDTDAYGHFIIARLLWDTPRNLDIHWVWLPFYHALLALPVRLGATLDHVRSANAVLAALPALVLYLTLTATGGAAAQAPLRERALSGEAPAVLAALLVALDPLGMQLGTTGQMEIVFSCLLLAAVALLVCERFAAAAAVLGVLVLTRYEGWAVASTVGAVLVYRRLRGGPRLGGGRLACLLVPALCVLGWAALRRLGGGAWFGFLFDNQAFAERVLERSPPAHGVLGALGRYTVGVPYRVFGLAALLAPLGIWRTGQRHGVWLVAPGLALVAFLTLTSLSRSQLGLDRHFLSVVPFAATWVAHGAAGCANALAGWVGRRWPGAARPGVADVLGAALGGVVLVVAAARLAASLGPWKEITRAALPEPRALAQLLRATEPASVIFCPDASIEVLSQLDRERFVRAPVNAATAPLLLQLNRTLDVYVVDRAARVPALLAGAQPIHGTLDGPPDAFVALRLPAGSRLGAANVAALP